MTLVTPPSESSTETSSHIPVPNSNNFPGRMINVYFRSGTLNAPEKYCHTRITINEKNVNIKYVLNF